MNILPQLIVFGIINGLLFSLLAISFGIVYRSLKFFHIAFAGIFTSSCYFIYIFYSIFKFPVVISFILSCISTSFLGLLIEKFVYLPFFRKKATSGVLLVSSLGIYISLENLIALIFGNETKILLSGVQPTYSFGNVIITSIQFFEFFLSLFVIILFIFAFKKLKIFKALWAIGDEPDLISIMGLPLIKFRAFIFILSSFILAIPANLISMDIGMDPHNGMHYLLIAAVSVIFGGIDSFYGWWFGGLIIGVLQSLIIIKFSARWIELVTFLILIIILLYRPYGIFGERKRIEELK